MAKKDSKVKEVAKSKEAVLVNNVDVKENDNKVDSFERKTKILKTNLNKTIKQLHKMWRKKELNFELAIQRGEVWSGEQKTNLIYSLLYGYYIPSVIAEFRTNDTSIYFLDGKQRLTTIMRFLDGEWALSRNMKDIYGQSFAGFKFKDLPEEVQDMIFEESIDIVKMENLTKEERDMQFVYLNMGSALSQIEKTRAMHSDLITDINRLVQHSFFIDGMSITNAGRVKLVDQETLLQIAMLADEGKNGIKGFGSAQIRNYVLKLKETESVLSDIQLNRIEKTLDYMTFSVGTFTEVERRQALKKIHVPMIFHVAETAMENKMTPKDFGQFLLDFLVKKYSVESLYGVACQAGSSKKESVLIRLNEMTKALVTFQAKPIVEEVKLPVEEKPVVEKEKEKEKKTKGKSESIVKK